MTKLNWHVLFAISELLGALLFSGTAYSQCPDGNCPTQPFGYSQPYYQQPFVAQPARTPAKPTALAEYHEAVLFVGRGSAAGTGTLVAVENNKGLVLTAGHVVNEGGNCWVQFGKTRYPARLLGYDMQPDIAALVVDNPPDITPIPLAYADEAPYAGESVEVIGYGGGSFRHYMAPVKGYSKRDSTASDQINVDFRCISGDSGGPILYKGKVVGVLWGGPSVAMGQPPYETHGACCLRIRQFLERHNAVRKPPAKKKTPGKLVEGGGIQVGPRISVGPGGTEIGPLINVGPRGRVVDDCDDCQSLVASLQARVDSLEQTAAKYKDIDLATLKGEHGPAGKDGRDGADGKDGAPGKDADVSQIVAQITAGLRKERVTLEVVDASGRVQRTSGGLGGNPSMKIRLTPVLKAAP